MILTGGAAKDWYASRRLAQSLQGNPHRHYLPLVYELIPLANLEIGAPGYYEGSQYSDVSR